MVTESIAIQVGDAILTVAVVAAVASLVVVVVAALVWGLPPNFRRLPRRRKAQMGMRLCNKPNNIVGQIHHRNPSPSSGGEGDFLNFFFFF